MRLITPFAREALHGIQATRSLEQAAAAALPAGTLMARAGLAVARLSQSLAPHAQRIWVACGPGNNGGDGLVAAVRLQAWAAANQGVPEIVVTWRGDELHLPEDARRALSRARSEGLKFVNEAPASFDLAIDALLGIGQRRPATGQLASDLQLLASCDAPVLCVDTPSELDAETGACTFVVRSARGPRHTLTLLTLKPGLFTAQGRDRAGSVWFDDLDCKQSVAPTAWLAGRALNAEAKSRHHHANHKGSYGDVVVIGGQDMALHGAGMTGAALLAARASLHAGAGRVFVALLKSASTASTGWDPVSPELMFRCPSQLLDSELMQQASVVCGCGGGSEIAALLPRVLSRAARLVLDADALNAVALDPVLQTLLVARSTHHRTTVLTPHPLEAARLLDLTTAEVMSDRILSAQRLADQFQTICVLKGSGTIIAAPGQTPLINPTGNASLATAGTGDVLAGMLGAVLAGPAFSATETLERVAAAIFQHGWQADQWDQSNTTAKEGFPGALTAGKLAASVRPIR